MESPPSSSISKALPVADSGERNWLDLPRDVVQSIFLKLGTVKILTCAQRVCSVWRNISMDPVLWSTIDMRKVGDFELMSDEDLEVMCRRLIDYSSGHLLYINIEYFGTDDLLHYITDSTSHLRSLRLSYCDGISNEGLCDVAKKLPQLEELEISFSSILFKDTLEVIGRCCPHLKSLKFNKQGRMHPEIWCDEEAFAIAETMPELRHLQLFGNKLTNDGLLAILDGCPHLESLDLRQCFSIDLKGSLGKRCAEQIKDLLGTYDYAPDGSFLKEMDYGSDWGESDGDYPSGISDFDLLSDDDYDHYVFSGGSEFSEYDYDNYYDF